MQEKNRVEQQQEHYEQRNQEIIKETADYVRKKLERECSGHDWWHAYRVWQLAKRIGKHEGADLFVVELAALLHDIADWKFHDGDETVGPRLAGEWLQQCCVEEEMIKHIQNIIKDISFKGVGVATPMTTVEGKVVQDADRLDAIGAVGIARCFAYGGHKGFGMHDPEQNISVHRTADEYKKNKSTSLNHFYEKLFLLKDRMNTSYARIIAHERHEFMELFVKTFLKEWDGSDAQF